MAHQVNKPLVFLDMDGVLADFIGHLTREMEFAPENVNPVHDLQRAFQMPLSGIEPFIRKANFWRDIPTPPWAKKLVAALQENHDLFILSRPWDDQPFCLADKAIWCDRHLGIAQDRILLTKYKQLLSRPGRFLIDDYADNCAAWAHFGGMAIEFPARHNTWQGLNHETDDLVEWTLARLISAKKMFMARRQRSVAPSLNGLNGHN